MTHDAYVTMEFVAAGGVDVVLKNANESDPEKALGRLSYAVLSVVADTTIGRKVLMELQAIEKAIGRLPSSTCILYTYFVLRFLEVCSQHKDTVRVMLQVKVLGILVNKYLFYSKQPLLNPLCIPCLQAVKNILLDHRDILHGDELNELNPLKHRWQSSAYIHQKTPASERKPLNVLLQDVITLIDPKLVEIESRASASNVTRVETPFKKRPASMGITDGMLRAFKDQEKLGGEEISDSDDSSTDSESEDDDSPALTLSTVDVPLDDVSDDVDGDEDEGTEHTPKRRDAESPENSEESKV